MMIDDEGEQQNDSERVRTSCVKRWNNGKKKETIVKGDG